LEALSIAFSVNSQLFDDALILFGIEPITENMGRFLGNLLANLKAQATIYFMVEIAPDANGSEEVLHLHGSVVNIEADSVVRGLVDSVLIHGFFSVEFSLPW